MYTGECYSYLHRCAGRGCIRNHFAQVYYPYCGSGCGYVRKNINPVSFLYCGLLTIGFSMIVNLFMHQKLKKIDMVESLKSVE